MLVEVQYYEIYKNLNDPGNWLNQISVWILEI